MTCKGEIKDRKFKPAMILLKADEGLSDPQIMAAINVSRPKVDWQFFTAGARIKLKQLYPSISD